MNNLAVFIEYHSGLISLNALFEGLNEILKNKIVRFVYEKSSLSKSI